MLDWLRFKQKNIDVCSDLEIILIRNNLFKVLNNSKGIKDLRKWINFLNENLKFEEVFKENLEFPNEWASYLKLNNEIDEGEFKNYCVKDFSTLTKQKDEAYLTTRHSSKGLEFEVVVVIGMEDGSFPFYKNFDIPEKFNEEERLFFVCLSRAKRICYLLMSKEI